MPALRHLNQNFERPPTAAAVRRQRERIIAEAVRTNTADQWYWYVKMRVPPRYRTGLGDDGDDRLACWPDEYMPVIPLIVDLTGEYARWLAQWFQHHNPDSEFTPALAYIETLQKDTRDRWYPLEAFRIDQICPYCGQVWSINFKKKSFVCDCGGIE